MVRKSVTLGSWDRISIDFVHSIRKDMVKVCQHMGYCPQFDALDPLLTGREHLEFYARVRGIPSAEVKSVSHFSLFWFIWFICFFLYGALWHSMEVCWTGGLEVLGSNRTCRTLLFSLSKKTYLITSFGSGENGYSFTWERILPYISIIFRKWWMKCIYICFILQKLE